jgi:TolB protein
VEDGTPDPDIYTMTADGQGLVSLTSAAGTSDGDPSWSGDGERIVFERDPASGNRELWVMNHDGTGQTLVTTQFSPENPDFFPDGRRIAFVGNVSGEQVFVVDIDGTDVTQLTFPGAGDGSAFGPAVSPDGGRIAFTRGGGIWVMNADGSGQVRLTTGSDTVSDNDPEWSPDGARIVFRRSTTPGPGAAADADLVVMNADGSGQTPLTSGDDDDREPAFAPDGSLVAFERSSMGTSSSNIFVTSPAGLNQGTRPLSQGARASGAAVLRSDPNWQPLNPPACGFARRSASRRSGRVRFRITCGSENATAVLSGSVSVRSRAGGRRVVRRFRLRGRRLVIPQGTPTGVSLAAPRRSRRALRRALRTGGGATARARARLTDDLGQSSTRSFRVRLSDGRAGG